MLADGKVFVKFTVQCQTTPVIIVRVCCVLCTKLTTTMSTRKLLNLFSADSVSRIECHIVLVRNSIVWPHLMRRLLHLHRQKFVVFFPKQKVEEANKCCVIMAKWTMSNGNEELRESKRRSRKTNYLPIVCSVLETESLAPLPIWCESAAQFTPLITWAFIFAFFLLKFSIFEFSLRWRRWRVHEKFVVVATR